MNYWFSVHLQYSLLSFFPRDIFDWCKNGKMSERQKEGEKKLAAYGTSDKRAPRWSARLQRMDAMHQGTATVPPSQTAIKKKKVQNQIASDKEGMSSRAIHRHSACGEVLKKKKKKAWPKAEAFVFIQKSQETILWIHHWKSLPGFCLAITINRWWLFHRLGHLVSS